MEQDDKDFIVFEQTIGKSLDLMWQELSANDISRVRHNLFLMQQGFQNREAAKRIFETIKSYLLGTNDDEIAHDFILDLVLRGMDDYVLPLIDYSLSFLSEKPYKINVFSVLIVEMLNLNSQNTLEANRATLLTLLSEITRARDTINEAKALDNENEIIEESINLSYSQIAMQSLIDIPSTAPNFYLLFAYILRQTAIVHIPEFLSYYQTKHEDGDYFLFLRGVLNENEDLFSKSQIKTVKEWVKKYKNRQIIEITNNVVEEIPIIGFDPILGRLNKEKFATFLTFLCNETNGDTEPFLSKEVVVKLIENGLALPKEGNEIIKYEISITAKKTLKTIYHCFYKLFEVHQNNRFCKEQIAIYLKTNFSNFDDLAIGTLKNSMKSVKASSMTFEISKYLS